MLSTKDFVSQGQRARFMGNRLLYFGPERSISNAQRSTVGGEVAADVLVGLGF
jgi:hypothetical protein